MHPPKLQAVPSTPLFSHSPSTRLGFYHQGILQLLPAAMEISQAGFERAWKAGWQAGSEHRPNCAHHYNSVPAFVYQYAFEQANAIAPKNDRGTLLGALKEAHSQIPF